MLALGKLVEWQSVADRGYEMLSYRCRVWVDALAAWVWKLEMLAEVVS